MLVNFLTSLRDHRIPVSTRELLDCICLLRHRLAIVDIQQFYFLSRMSLVKDEKYFDRFDLAFDAFFKGLDNVVALFEDSAQLPMLEEFLKHNFPKLPERERKDILDEYQRSILCTGDAALQEKISSAANKHDHVACKTDKGVDIQSDEQHTANEKIESPNEDQKEIDCGEGEGEQGEKGSGEDGEEGDGEGDGDGEGEEGVSGEGKNGVTGIGEGEQAGVGIRNEFELESQRSAKKVWQLRSFESYDADAELGTRNLKMALRRLRKFARRGAELELDMANTIHSTARNAGLLDIIEVPERHNNVKVLLFLDVGGSMDEHIELCRQLFAAAKSEFKYLEIYYFHNFIYDYVWTSNERHDEERVNIIDIIHKYGADYKTIFVGDANMAREEIAEQGGCVERYNNEAGQLWLRRIQDQYSKIVWLNPTKKLAWKDVYSVQMINRLIENKMYHLSVDGIEQGMKYLSR